MTGLGPALKRLVRRLLGPAEDDPPLAPRLSEEEAISLAGAAVGGFREWHEPISALPDREDKTGRIVWRVITNSDCYGAHIHVKIDDATGKAIKVVHVPR